MLDSHFPDAGDTEIFCVAFILDQYASLIAQQRITRDKPEESVGVEQKIH
jgi:hypothetical protein